MYIDQVIHKCRNHLVDCSLTALNPFSGQPEHFTKRCSICNGLFDEDFIKNHPDFKHDFCIQRDGWAKCKYCDLGILSARRVSDVKK